MEIILLNRQNQIQDIISKKEILNLDFYEVINDLGKGSFELSLQKSNDLYDLLKSNNRFLIRHNNELLFGGHIYGIKPTYGLTNTFYIQDLLGYLKNRFLRADKNYNGYTITAALTDLFSYIDGIEDTYIDLNCNIIDVIDGGDYKEGQSIYYILQDLLSNQYEFNIFPTISGTTVNFVLNVGTILGIDRTVEGDNYREYKINLGTNKKGNISKLEGTMDLNYFANFVIADKNGTFTTKNNATSIADIGLIENSIKVSNNLEDESQAYLDSHSDLYKGITIETLTIDYSEVGLGDLVRIIAKGNKFLELDTTLKVVKKKFKLAEIDNIQFEFNTTKILKKDFFEDYNELKNKVNSL